jgi:hypothetical protein
VGEDEEEEEEEEETWSTEMGKWGGGIGGASNAIEQVDMCAELQYLPTTGWLANWIGISQTTCRGWMRGCTRSDGTAAS